MTRKLFILMMLLAAFGCPNKNHVIYMTKNNQKPATQPSEPEPLKGLETIPCWQGTYCHKGLCIDEQKNVKPEDFQVIKIKKEESLLIDSAYCYTGPEDCSDCDKCYLNCLEEFKDYTAIITAKPGKTCCVRVFRLKR